MKHAPAPDPPSNGAWSAFEGLPLPVILCILTLVAGASVLLTFAVAGLPDRGMGNADAESLDAFQAMVLFAACGVMVGLQYAVNQMPVLGERWERLQLKRRVQHASSGVLIAALYVALPLSVAVGGLATGFGALALLQLLRKSRTIEGKFIETFGAMLKEEERRGAPPAAFSFLAGSLVCAAGAPYEVCLSAMLGASLGDPAASIVGRLVGGPQLRSSKTLSGFVACLLVAGLGGLCAAASADLRFGSRGGDRLSSFATSGAATAVAEVLSGEGSPLSALGRRIGGLPGALLGDDNFATLLGGAMLLTALRMALGPPGHEALQ